MRRAPLAPLLLLGACSPPDVQDAGPPAAFISVDKSGDGRGTISSTPTGISCDVACEREDGVFTTLPESGTIALEFEPARDAQFLSWSCDDGTESTIPTIEVEVAIGATVTCTAESRRIVILQVLTIGDGSGHVVGTLTGNGGSATALRVDCPTDCDGAYFVGDTETIAAVPDQGSVFVGWGLECAGTTTPLDVVMDDDKFCEAEFAPQ